MEKLLKRNYRKQVAKPTSFIELNGLQYNARTGVVIDGIQSAKRQLTSIQNGRVTNLVRANTPSKIMHNTTQPSKTLMRHVVKKPSTITDRKVVAMDVVRHSPHEKATNVFHTPNPDRIKRADSVHRLSLVSRFGHVRSNDTKQQQSKAVTAPVSGAKSPKISSVMLSSAPNIRQQSASSNKTNKLLDQGMRSANSHEVKKATKQKLHHRIGVKFGLSKRATSMFASSLAVLALGGFFMYQNIPNLNVRYASAKSGVRASIPGYQPAGFAVNNHVTFSPGELTIAYKANADNRNYTVSQKNTSWDSEALKNHIVNAIGSMPMTYPDSGRTIYLHDDSSADWVQGGVWYSITGNSSLNTDQLIKIATSI